MRVGAQVRGVRGYSPQGSPADDRRALNAGVGAPWPSTLAPVRLTGSPFGFFEVVAVGTNPFSGRLDGVLRIARNARDRVGRLEPHRSPAERAFLHLGHEACLR